MSRGQTALAGVSFSATAGILSIAAGILLLPVVIAKIGAAPYGVWLVFTSAATLLNYSDLGIGAALVHFGSRLRAGDASLGSDRELLSAAILWSGIAAIIATPAFAVFAGVYARSVSAVDDSATAFMALLATVLVFISLAMRPYSAALVSQGRLALEREFQIAATLFRILASLAACLLFEDIRVLAAAEALAISLPFVMAWVAIMMSPARPARICRATLTRTRRMLSFSARSFVVNFTGVAILQAGTIIVGLVLGPAQTTYYMSAFRVYTAVRQLMSWVIDPFRSMFSRLRVADYAEFMNALYAIAFGVIVVASLGGATVAIGAPALVQIWLGDSVPTSEVAMAISVLAASLAVNALHLPLIPAGDASGRPGVFFSTQVTWLVSYVVLAFPLTYYLGIVGTAIALVAPLPLVESLYLMRARNAIPMPLRTWADNVIVPAFPVLGGQVVGFVLGLPSLLLPDPYRWLVLSICALGGGLSVVFALRNRSAFLNVARHLRDSL